MRENHKKIYRLQLRHQQDRHRDRRSENATRKETPCRYGVVCPLLFLAHTFNSQKVVATKKKPNNHTPKQLKRFLFFAFVFDGSVSGGNAG